jgi:hypothetical protein
MPTKRGPIIKKLRQLISNMPPENLFPWKTPTNSMKKIINTQIRGKLEGSVQEVQDALMRQYIEKLKR